MTAGIKEENSMKKLLSSFQPSPDQLFQSSSVYSLIPEKEERDPRRDVSGLSLDPMRQPTSVEINLAHTGEKEAIEEPIKEPIKESIKEPIEEPLCEKADNSNEQNEANEGNDAKQYEVDEPANATKEQLIETSQKSNEISQESNINQKPIPNHYDRPTAYSQASVFREEADN